MIFFDIDDTLTTHSRAQTEAARLFWERFADSLAHVRQDSIPWWCVSTTRSPVLPITASGWNGSERQRKPI